MAENQYMEGVNRFNRAINIVDEKIGKENKEKVDKIKAYRKEVSRRASMANKRIKRLEKAGMTSSPAYQSWLRDGGEYFSIRGKSYNQVQSEMAKINRYLDSATSSITGAKKVLQEISKNTGTKINWSDWEEAREQASNFFEIASQVEQYLRTVEDSASAIGYQKIWEAINEYVEKTGTDLSYAKGNVEDITGEIVKAMKVWNEEDEIQLGDRSTGGVWGVSALPKDTKKR